MVEAFKPVDVAKDKLNATEEQEEIANEIIARTRENLKGMYIPTFTGEAFKAIIPKEGLLMESKQAATVGMSEKMDNAVKILVCEAFRSEWDEVRLEEKEEEVEIILKLGTLKSRDSHLMRRILR